MNDWKKRLNVVYSTNPDYHYEKEGEKEVETLPKDKQILLISLDSRRRRGKSVTLVKGFIGAEEELHELGRLLKMRCGVGGSVKDDEIIVQGDHRQKVLETLRKEGYVKARIHGR